MGRPRRRRSRTSSLPTTVLFWLPTRVAVSLRSSVAALLVLDTRSRTVKIPYNCGCGCGAELACCDAGFSSESRRHQLFMPLVGLLLTAEMEMYLSDWRVK